MFFDDYIKYITSEKFPQFNFILELNKVSNRLTTKLSLEKYQLIFYDQHNFYYIKRKS